MAIIHFIRMTWHAAELTGLRTAEAGAVLVHRGLPLNSWPDNGNLDKARRLSANQAEIWQQISWADLLILARM